MARPLKEIFLEEKAKTKETHITEPGKDGTYIAVHFARSTQTALKSLAKALEIKNIVERNKMHCTVVFSRKPFADFTIHGKLSKPWIGTPTKLEIFPTQNGARALVLRFDCPEMKERHEYFAKEHGATYDYDEYKIHVTLCYDVGADFEIPKNFDINKYVDKLEVTEEYYEPLNNDWASKATEKDKKENE